ncbi:hypothetical protein [Candidatus Nitrospira bockiana]
MTLRLTVALILILLAGVSLLDLVGHVLGRTGERLLEETLTSSSEKEDDRMTTAHTLLQRAREWEPWNPAHAFAYGRWLQAQASDKPVDSSEYLALMAHARHAYRSAVQRHPLNAEYQLFAGWTDYLTGDVRSAKRSIENALRLYPQDPWIWFEATRWYLSRWPDLDAADRERVAELVRIGAPNEPKRYVELCWDTLQDPALIRAILPRDRAVREQLTSDLTDRLYFAHRWSEEAADPQLIQERAEGQSQIIRAGILPQEADVRSLPSIEATSWQGTHDGWLSGHGAATAEVHLPEGEALLVLDLEGESAGGEAPVIYLQLDDHGLGQWSVDAEDTMPWYALVRTPGGSVSIKVFLMNGKVVHQQGGFFERRVALGPVHVITPQMVRPVNQ